MEKIAWLLTTTMILGEGASDGSPSTKPLKLQVDRLSVIQHCFLMVI